MGIGDWGLGIAQSPIPNPQSPTKLFINNKVLINLIKYFKIIYTLNYVILVLN